MNPNANLNLSLHLNKTRLMGELHHLATFTDCPSPTDPAFRQPAQAVTRIVFTRRDLEARSFLKGLAADAGLRVREDAVGNTFLRWEGSEPALPAVGTGSHTDAIPHAGMYDGTVGVLGGLEAFRALKESGFQPRRSLELVLFTSEEPTRFGIGCLGSRLLGGALAPEVADALPDRLHETEPNAEPGQTLRKVREEAGFHGPLADVRLATGHYSAWLELHIEQGPLLERAGLGCGIVTAIAGPSSYRFTTEGSGGHAGALPMSDRHDALCAAAEVVLAIEAAAHDANRASGGTDTVATVGTLHVHPGAANSVPSRVSFSLDLRDTVADRREAVLAAIRASIRRTERERGVRLSEECIHADDPAVSDPQLLKVLETACRTEGASFRPMVSRAYHDTSFLARIAPVAMLFIPCRDGVSHRPDEYATPEAITCGVRVLARALRELSLR